MANQYKNKVVYGNQTLMDITDTTAEANDVIEGQLFYTRSGAPTTGTLGDATTTTHGLMSAEDKIKLDSVDLTEKADKVTNATNGNFAGLDANGNLTDSGVSAASLLVIDDTAGTGDTDRVWSADKLTTELAAKAPTANPVFTDSINMGRVLGSTVGANSVAAGGDVIASGSVSHAEGVGTTASGVYSHAEGSGTTASGGSSHAEGSGATASGYYSHAEGYGGTYISDGIAYTSGAIGAADHTEGYQCLTASNQPGNHAEGYQTRATGGAAHAEGSSTIASGSQSHAEGYSAIAFGYVSHAEGGSTTASGNYSHAEGGGTTASGSSSHAEGGGTKATNSQSHAEGGGTTASGIASHAEGNYTIAAGAYSHAGGSYNVEDSYTNWPEWVANTEYSVGDKVKVTTGSGSSQTITGYICKTANSDSSFTSSNWNNQNGKMNYAEIIGNGDSSARSNARTLDWDGNERLKGDLYVGCNADSTGGTKVVKATDTMTGATSSAAGTSGLVPAPAIGDNTKFLRGDGTWQDCAGSTLTKIPFSFIQSDWVLVNGLYQTVVQNLTFIETSEEFVTYDSSVINLSDGLSVTKDTTNNEMIFTTALLPVGTISGNIFSIANTNGNIAVTYVDDTFKHEIENVTNVVFPKSDNIYDPSLQTSSTISPHYFVNGAPYSSTQFDSSWNCTALIPVKPNTTYSIGLVPAYSDNQKPWGSAGYGVFNYDANGTYISNATTGSSFTTPSNGRYIRFNYMITNGYNLSLINSRCVIIEGASLPSDYIPYNLPDIGSVVETKAKTNMRVIVNNNSDTVDVIYKYNNAYDFVVRFGVGGGNGLLDFRGLFTIQNGSEEISEDASSAVSFYSGTGDDWHAPFVVAAVNNGDGDHPTTENFTGGNHQYNNLGSGSTPTARVADIKFILDNRQLSAGTNICGNKLEIKWSNYVQGYNTSKADGTGREILKEEHRMVFDGEHWNSYVSVIALENISVHTWYGFQWCGNMIWNHVRYIGGTNRTDMIIGGTATNCGNYTTHKTYCYGTTHSLMIEIDPYYDLGDLSELGTHNSMYTTDYNKGYCYLIDYKTFNANEVFSAHCTYTFKAV